MPQLPHRSVCNCIIKHHTEILHFPTNLLTPHRTVLEYTKECEMNDLKMIKHDRRMTYDDISAAIESRTGRRYNPDYLGNVARGEVALSDGLRLHLYDTFRDSRLLPSAQKRADIH